MSDSGRYVLSIEYQVSGLPVTRHQVVFSPQSLEEGEVPASAMLSIHTLRSYEIVKARVEKASD